MGGLSRQVVSYGSGLSREVSLYMVCLQGIPLSIDFIVKKKIRLW